MLLTIALFLLFASLLYCYLYIQCFLTTYLLVVWVAMSIVPVFVAGRNPALEYRSLPHQSWRIIDKHGAEEAHQSIQYSS
jgi:hypothetical protein